MSYVVPESKSSDGYYGKAYQQNMVSKYKNRENNHRKSRIELAHRLVDDYALPRLEEKGVSNPVFLDVGCAIGTFPIEFAKRGFRAYGIDFSPSGIELARELASEEGVKAEFVCGDVVSLDKNFPSIDIANCFDIFEHLHDDEIGGLLQALKSRLSPQGIILFHTYPTQYDHIFFGRSFVWWPLALFAPLPPSSFLRVLKIYSAFIDMIKVAFNGGTQRDLIKDEAHCNLLTQERLKDIFQRAGYEVIHIETSNLIKYNALVERVFSSQPIVRRDLQGAAIPVNSK